MDVFKKVILAIGFVFFCLGLQGQVDVGNRIETVKDFSSEPVWIEKTENFFLGYQSNRGDASRQINLHVFFAKQDFTEEASLKIPLRFSHLIKKQKAIGDNFYFLCENSDLHLNENYILAIDMNSKDTQEIDLEKSVRGRIVDFEVMDNRILFLTNSQQRIVAQILEVSTNKTYTVEDVYQPGMMLQKVFHDQSAEEFHLLFSFRKPDKSKSFLWSTFNKEGIILKNVILEHDQKNLENIELLLTGDGALPFIAGTIGETRKVGYKGYYAGYLAQGLNPFENVINILGLNGFFSFEKDGGEKSQRKWEKSKNPSLKGVLASRNLIQNESGFLLHSDHFLAVGKSHEAKDGVYDHHYYHFNPMKDLNYGRRGTAEPIYATGTGVWIPTPEIDPDIYFSFKSSHFLQLDYNGEVLWDYAIPLPKKSTFVPLSYGQLVTGNGDHFIYEFDG